MVIEVPTNLSLNWNFMESVHIMAGWFCASEVKRCNHKIYSINVASLQSIRILNY